MMLNGLGACNCANKSCPRFGKCEQCVAYHKTTGVPPFCMRKTAQKKNVDKSGARSVQT